jgi:hypothetical protein
MSESIEVDNLADNLEKLSVKPVPKRSVRFEDVVDEEKKSLLYFFIHTSSTHTF